MVSLFLGYLVALLAVVLTIIIILYNLITVARISLERSDEVFRKALGAYVLLSILQILGLWFGAVQLIQAL